MLDLDSRELMCACRACSTLFDRGSVAGGGHFRLIPDRRLHIIDFEMSEMAWEQLRIPVDMAFFFHNSAAERVGAFYPSPAGPTESQLELDAWDQIAVANSVLETMEHDVEALLVNRSKGANDHWLVPIEDCYSLIAVIRTHWKGLSGGKEVWMEIASFFDDLDRRSKAVDKSGTKQKTNVAAPVGAAGGR